MIFRISILIALFGLITVGAPVAYADYGFEGGGNVNQYTDTVDGAEIATATTGATRTVDWLGLSFGGGGRVSDCEALAASNGQAEGTQLWCVQKDIANQTGNNCVYTCQNTGDASGINFTATGSLTSYLYTSQPTIETHALGDRGEGHDCGNNNEARTLCVFWATSVASTGPTASLTATPGSIESGESSTLTWSSTNATSCTGTGFSTGGATSGSVAVSPTETTNYVVTCIGGSGSATSSTWTYSHSDTSDFWCPVTDPNKAYKNVPNCTTMPGAACTTVGENCKVNTVSGCNINTDIWTCSGGAGSSQQSATASATVEVTAAPVATALSCNASPSSVTPGTPVTFTVSPTGLSPYTWTPSETGTALAGTGTSVSRTYAANGTYAMTVSKSGYTSGTCNVNVGAAPLCTGGNVSVTASPERVTSGQSSTLTISGSGINTTCVVRNVNTNAVIQTITATACNLPTTIVGTGSLTTQTSFSVTCDTGVVTPPVTPTTGNVIVNVIPRIIEF